MSAALLANHSELDLRILVSEDGSVEKAEILNPSGDAVWDALAKDRMKEWIFSPAILNGKPITMWINFHAHVKSETPVYIGLGKLYVNRPLLQIRYIPCSRLESLLTRLPQTSRFQIKGNHGDLGQVDISRYGERLRRFLKD